jgi:pimeloyl-ACP methyl ester carboxylesterase
VASHGVGLTVARFPAHDGTQLAITTVGDGAPLLCLPGGPARAAEYLGDLGGLSTTRTLLLLDQRGVGRSAVPSDPSTYRVDRLVEDVEAARRHLDLDPVDLLAHSAGASLALLYAARFPERIGRLVLVTPSLNVVSSLQGTPEELEAVLARRADEPWYADAHAALMQRFQGDAGPDVMRRMAPFSYGRWDDAAADHADRDAEQRSAEGAAGYYADLTVDEEQVRGALAALDAPVHVTAGDVDLHPSPPVAARLAALFRHGELSVQPGAAHYPWLDDPAAFCSAVEGFLARS